MQIILHLGMSQFHPSELVLILNNNSAMYSAALFISRNKKMLSGNDTP